MFILSCHFNAFFCPNIHLSSFDYPSQWWEPHMYLCLFTWPVIWFFNISGDHHTLWCSVLYEIIRWHNLYVEFCIRMYDVICSSNHRTNLFGLHSLSFSGFRGYSMLETLQQTYFKEFGSPMCLRIHEQTCFHAKNPGLQLFVSNAVPLETEFYEYEVAGTFFFVFSSSHCSTLRLPILGFFSPETSFYSGNGYSHKL